MAPAEGRANSAVSVSSSPSSTKSRRHSFFKLFGSRSSPSKNSKSRSSLDVSRLHDVDEDDTSDDDKSIDLNSYHAAVAPLRFKPFKASSKRHIYETTDLAERLHMMLDDEDYEKYLRQPKHIRTFRKSHKTAPIAKRLFLAQELRQDNTGSVTDIDHMLEFSRHDDPSEQQFETMSSVNANTNAVGSLSHSGTTADVTNGTQNSVWAMRFSLDGKYLATAGKGNIIRVWKVISSPLDRMEFSSPTAATASDETVVNGIDENSIPDRYNDKKMNYASVFQDQPYRSYIGHTNDILSLDWSKNNFLLSSSMDKTVRLWNTQQTRCLRTYQHRDFVTSVKFHPTDDRFFISGCLDHGVRLWSILENEIKYEFDAKNLVTAVAFTPKGSMIIAGTFNGKVYFLDSQTLELRHELELNNKKKKENLKITGIECYVDQDDVKVLVTSNDSRIRLISLKNKQMEFYFKGLDNNSSQIIATVSDDNRYIISGSENHWLYIWEVQKYGETPQKTDHNVNGPGSHGLLGLVGNRKKKRKDYISFHAHHHVITCALIAPSGTFKALSLSNDYIYELNSELSSFSAVDDSEKSKARGGTRSASLIDDEGIGGIIVTADDHGLIRVFRQDLPSSVRKLLLNEKKRRDTMKDVPTSHQESPHRGLLNKTLNVSSSSVLSRGNSIRSNHNSRPHGLNSTDISPTQGRSRSGTTDSITQKLANSNSQKRLTCEVCGGENFAVVKGTGGLDVFCTDCGNQIKT